MKLSVTLDDFLECAANDARLQSGHISLFTALFHLDPGDTKDGFFRVSRKELLRYSKFRSISTYHKRIKELVDFGYVVYLPSYDYYKGSRVSLLTPRHSP